MTPELAEKLQHLPDKPGVYLMKDGQGKIIYVGKAVVLKNRVRSYFQASRNLAVKVQVLVSKIADLEYIVTGSEMEALILECNLIKKYQPRYNIRLRDDKSYPYIKVTTNETFPRVYATRKVQKDGARYFGPYTNAGAVHDTIRLLKRLFPLRSCRQMNSGRPCLQFHIHRCLAPCTGNIDNEFYGEMIKSVCLFLEGRSEDVARNIKRAMAEAVAKLEFERAAQLRDQLLAVQNVTEKQNIITGTSDQDIIGLARSVAGTCVQVFFIRAGKMVGREHFLMTGDEEDEDGAVLTAFLQQYYSRAGFIPREIILPLDIADKQLFTDWLQGLRNGRVVLEVPQRGTKKELVTMAAGNAQLVLAEQTEKMRGDEQAAAQAVGELSDYLGLTKAAKRIECFDISHIQGSETVASMVVFTDGMPDKHEYRRFKIQMAEGKPDDFLSMQEVVLRRYRHAAEPLPDLVIIDGGKGQLSVALEVIRGVGLPEIPVIGLAKEFEHIFCPGKSDPLILPRQSPALFLVQRIRDEAHRFAITYHRKLRSKRNMVSVLDHIPGIGEKRRQSMWQHFGTINKIKQAVVEELIKVPGMNKTAAQAVYDFFHSNPD